MSSVRQRQHGISAWVTKRHSPSFSGSTQKSVARSGSIPFPTSRHSGAVEQGDLAPISVRQSNGSAAPQCTEGRCCDSSRPGTEAPVPRRVWGDRSGRPDRFGRSSEDQRRQPRRLPAFSLDRGEGREIHENGGQTYLGLRERLDANYGLDIWYSEILCIIGIGVGSATKRHEYRQLREPPLGGQRGRETDRRSTRSVRVPDGRGPRRPRSRPR